MNQLVATAVAEKRSSMRTAAFVEEGRRLADLPGFRALLTRPGGLPPAAGDERLD